MTQGSVRLWLRAEGRLDLLPFALIWTAHIGFDRVLGYGLKYPTAFGDTHLGRIGPSPGATRSSAP